MSATDHMSASLQRTAKVKTKTSTGNTAVPGTNYKGISRKPNLTF